MVKSHFEETEEDAEVYEPMVPRPTSQDIMMKYSGCSEDVYESMLGIDPECAEDLCKMNMILFIDFFIEIVKLVGSNVTDDHCAVFIR